jgi:hypothetical protein
MYTGMHLRAFFSCADTAEAFIFDFRFIPFSPKRVNPDSVNHSFPYKLQRYPHFLTIKRHRICMT